MNVTMIRVSAAVLFATVFSATAHAEYRCDPAPGWVDQRACEAATQGSPDALRQYVESMNSIRVNLKMTDYVRPETVKAWEERSQLAARKEAEALQVARTEKR